MTFLELAHKRVSVRGYRPEPIPEHLLQQVLEAGQWAPSACNRQPWTFIVVREATQRQALKEAYGKDWFWLAPVIIVVCVDPATAWRRGDGASYAWVDAAIAMDHMTLCAADLGLGTCWIGAFKPAAVAAALGIPPGIDVVAMTPLGYPVDPGRPRQRKPLDEVVRYERW